MSKLTGSGLAGRSKGGAAAFGQEFGDS